MNLLSRLLTPTGTKGCARHVALAAPFIPFGVVPVARSGTKGHPLLSRPGVPGWETGAIEIFQSRQISVSVVVSFDLAASYPSICRREPAFTQLKIRVRLRSTSDAVRPKWKVPHQLDKPPRLAKTPGSRNPQSATRSVRSDRTCAHACVGMTCV